MKFPMALTARLEALASTGQCCDDLPGLVVEARASMQPAAATPPGPAPEDESLLRRRYEALGDPRRFLITNMLRRRPGLCGCELQAALGIGHATVSHHMAILSEVGLVEGTRDGRWIRYHLTDEAGLLVS